MTLWELFKFIYNTFTLLIYSVDFSEGRERQMQLMAAQMQLLEVTQKMDTILSQPVWSPVFKNCEGFLEVSMSPFVNAGKGLCL